SVFSISLTLNRPWSDLADCACINHSLWNAAEYDIRTRFPARQHFQRCSVEFYYVSEPSGVFRRKQCVFERTLFDAFTPGIAKNKAAVEGFMVIKTRKMRIKEWLRSFIGDRTGTCL